MTSAKSYTSRPTKGEVLIENAILTVGSSTLMEGNGFPRVLSAIVSPIWINEIFCHNEFINIKATWDFDPTWISSIPQTAQISPASTMSVGTLLNFSYTNSSLTLPNLHSSSEVQIWKSKRLGLSINLLRLLTKDSWLWKYSPPL